MRRTRLQMREDQEHVYCQQYRDYYQQQSERVEEWKQLRPAYVGWAQGLLESGLSRAELRLIAIAESNMMRGSLNWSELRSMLLSLNPQYTGTESRQSFSKSLRQEIYEQFKGSCYYCGCHIPLDATKERAELLDVLFQYDDRKREIREAARGNAPLRSQMKEELAASDLGHRYQRLCALYVSEGAINVPRAHVDHLLPLTRGGSNERENLVLACESCNLDKNMRTLEEFKAKPNDPISTLGSHASQLCFALPLYTAEQQGYIALPLLDGYPLSGLGALDGGMAEDVRWRIWAFRTWYDYQRQLHQWNDLPEPRSALGAAREEQLQQLVIDEVMKV